MHEIPLSADQLSSGLLNLSDTENVCLLDSCGVGHLGSHLLIAGISPVETHQLSFDDPHETLQVFNKKLTSPYLAAIFTIAYDFGLKLQQIKPREKEYKSVPEIDIFLALFDCLVVHDYDTRKTFVTGNEKKFIEVEELINRTASSETTQSRAAPVTSNFSKAEYLAAIGKIKEYIRAGDTYQTNLTQQLRCDLPMHLKPADIFRRLRKDHPAPFAAFLRRKDSTVISASPERFLRIENGRVSASPIKGTRPRGRNPEEDANLKRDLLESEKDRAENTMIVDLMRNDLGRICKFGSVKVEKLCDLEEHPTLFHLVSTISGELNDGSSFGDIIKAVFPCGSITGAPKIRTTQLIDEIETADRGLSMGAIGCHIPNERFGIPGSLDMSVAIRTMVVRNSEAIFNVGGGIVTDSDPAKEYEETMLKAKALLDALGSELQI